jgi:hypothetical protein
VTIWASGESRRPPAANLVRHAFVLAGILALGLGYVGLGQYVRDRDDVGSGPLDLLYYALQLFVLGAGPLDDGGPYPLALEIARFAAPAVTVYAVVEAGRLLLSAELRRLRIRRVRQHVIVCGNNPVAHTLTARMRDAGRAVVAVRADSSDADQARQPGLFVLVGDAREVDVLRVAGADRAHAVYACTEDSAANTAIALAAARFRRGRSMEVHARIDDPDLCLALQARHLALPQPPGLRIDFFNVDELAARLLFARQPLVPAQPQPPASDPDEPASGERPAHPDEPAPRVRPPAPPTVLIVGATAFGRAVAVEAIRSWRLNPMARERPMRLIIADQQAGAAKRRLREQYPNLVRACRVVSHDVALSVLLASDHTRPDRVFICYDDEERALKAALTNDRLWRGGTRSVVVRLDRLAGLRAAFHPGRNGDRLLDEVSGTLLLFGVVDAACDQVLAGDDLVERLARAIHQHYVLARTQREPGATAAPSTVSWPELSEPLRQANRAQAADIGRKLQLVGCVLAPRTGTGRAYDLAAHEVDQLARVEHLRWCLERTAAGWRLGRRHDHQARLHPGLTGWEKLAESDRVRCRDAIRDLAPILADAGLQIVRLTD